MLHRLRNIGPGIVIAATGLGAGDLVAASVAGAKFGTALLWAAVVGALMKFAMNEGLARWQLATGTTLLEGWVHRLPRVISIYFFMIDGPSMIRTLMRLSPLDDNYERRLLAEVDELLRE